MSESYTQNPLPGHDATTSATQRLPSMSSLRNRQLNRAATFTEGAVSMPQGPTMRRRSSVMSTLSLEDTRNSLRRSSTDSLFRPNDERMDKYISDEPEGSHWHSLPLSFVLLPAIAGLVWSNGSTIVSDLMIITLSCAFLYWCTRLPWDWYKAAQAPPEFEHFDLDARSDDTIIEEEEEEGSEGDFETVENPQATRQNNSPEPKTGAKPAPPEQLDALYGLRRTETVALVWCFLGPLLGAWLLHTMRIFLSPSSESLMNDVNLSVFVLVAEARPFALVCRLEKSRVHRLQTVAYLDPRAASQAPEELRNIAQRLDLLESRLVSVSESQEKKDVSKEVISSSVRQDLQPQLDALNRAVRRYEKRSVVQTMQTEARLNELEARLRDALSLAAAAARNGQKPGLVFRALEWIGGLIVYWTRSAWAVLVYPVYVAGNCLASIKRWITGPPKPQLSKRKLKSKSVR